MTLTLHGWFAARNTLNKAPVNQANMSVKESEFMLLSIWSHSLMQTCYIIYTIWLRGSWSILIVRQTVCDKLSVPKHVITLFLGKQGCFFFPSRIWKYGEACGCEIKIN